MVRLALLQFYGQGLLVLGTGLQRRLELGDLRLELDDLFLRLGFAGVELLRQILDLALDLGVDPDRVRIDRTLARGSISRAISFTTSPRTPATSSHTRLPRYTSTSSYYVLPST